MDSSSNDSENNVTNQLNALLFSNINLQLFFSRLSSFRLNTLEEEIPTDYTSSQTEEDEEVVGSEDMSNLSYSSSSDSYSNESYSFSEGSMDNVEAILVDETTNTSNEYDTESVNSAETTLINESDIDPVPDVELESDNNSGILDSPEPTEPPTEEESNDGQQEENTVESGRFIESEEENIEIRSKRKRICTESPSSKRVKSDSDGDEDEGRTCPICFDYWTNSGEHRLCSLKCGHLFGQKCVVRWLQSQTRKSCPTCKTKANLKQIRPIFAKKIFATDTVSIDNLKVELEAVKSDRNRLSYDVTRLTTINKNQQITIQQQAAKIYELQNKASKNDKNDNEQSDTFVRISFDKTLELSKDDGCRVLAHNLDNLLVVTLKSPNQLFSGYGIRKIKTNDYSITQFVPLHTKLIRDLAFHPQTGEWLLSVSLDKTAKLTNISTNTVLNTFVTDMPLWSCCWDSNDPNLFYVGGQRGCVLQFDTRNPSQPSKILIPPNDMSSVIALVSVNSGSGQFLPQGGLICCKLNSCWVFEQLGTHYIPKRINLEGPFVSLSYNKTWRQILISTRPNPRWVFCRHILCDLENGDDECLNVKTIHYFQGGTTQTHLSRNCQIELSDDILVLCYQETKRQINVWSVGTGHLIQTLPAPDPVIDMCYDKIRNQLIALTEKKIRVYNIK